MRTCRVGIVDISHNGLARGIENGETSAMGLLPGLYTSVQSVKGRAVSGCDRFVAVMPVPWPPLPVLVEMGAAGKGPKDKVWVLSDWIGPSRDLWFHHNRKFWREY